MTLRNSLLILSAVACINLTASATRPATGSATYYLGDNESAADGKRMAMEQARLAAIASEVGTACGATAPARLHAADVNGCWAGDTGTHSYSIDMTPDGVMAITCSLAGAVTPHRSSALNADVSMTPGDDSATVTVDCSSRGNVALYLLDDGANIARRLSPAVDAAAQSAGMDTAADGNIAMLPGARLNLAVDAPAAGQWLYVVVSEMPVASLQSAMTVDAFDSTLCGERQAGNVHLTVFPN